MSETELNHNFSKAHECGWRLKILGPEQPEADVELCDRWRAEQALPMLTSYRANLCPTSPGLR